MIVNNYYFCSNLLLRFYYSYFKKLNFPLNQKSYGFITNNLTNEEYFAHVSGLIDKMNVDCKVSFETIEDKRDKKDFLTGFEFIL